MGMQEIFHRFQIKGNAALWGRFGCGHINETYLVSCDSGLSYIFQKINTGIFSEPVNLMANISAVTAFLEKKFHNPRASMHLIRTVDNKTCLRAADGSWWRAYDFVTSSVCLQKAECPQDFYYAGLAFGQFQQMLADFPAKTLHEPIPNFHNTRARYAQLRTAIENDVMGRAASCWEDIDFYLAREHESGTLVDLLASGALPLRVTHNDTKLNNVLFDYDTRKPLCVIDLDTIMPGSALYDFGDSIRFGASTAPEDEKDLDQVWCDMELFRTYTEGFLKGCNGSLTPLELELLPMGAKLMTLECGSRFLADYLNGDTYFRTHYEGQNLDRARTQLKLVADMEAKWDTMNQIIKETAK